ncbi:MAG: PstS family phosphate ABC transporter substrate-binding protein [Candidatus Humimicrobiaceae bacterium]
MISTHKRKTISIIIPITLLCLFISILSGCSNNSDLDNNQSSKSISSDDSSLKFADDSLVLTGSTTLLEVSQIWAEEFMKKNGGKITVNGGGSGEGISSLLNGTTDLANSSRSIKKEEQDKADSIGMEIIENEVLIDGICMIISKNIGVKELTLDQLADIYMGNITNWKQLGGIDEDIVAAARDTNSGTGEYFLQKVIQKDGTQKDNDYTPFCLRMQSSGDVVNQVAGNDNTIGYIGVGYLKDAGSTVNVVSVKVDINSPAVFPSIETILEKTYPISRGLYIYSNDSKMSEIAKSYMEFVLSPEGQKIGEEAGFVKVQ